MEIDREPEGIAPVTVIRLLFATAELADYASSPACGLGSLTRDDALAALELLQADLRRRIVAVAPPATADPLSVTPGAPEEEAA